VSEKKINVQIIKRKYTMTNINTQETDYYLDIFFFLSVWQKKKIKVQIIKRKYIMKNINTQETDYWVYHKAG